MAPPEAPEADRDRSLLEKLLAPIDEERARPWAAQLVKRFGSLAAAISADEEALSDALGGAWKAVAHLRSVRAATLRCLRPVALTGPVFPDLSSITSYLFAAAAHDEKEVVRALFLDARNRLLRDEVVSTGSITSVAFPMREILKRCFDLGSTAIVLAHNHPSGDPTPSRSDVEATLMLTKVAQPLGISVHDHLVFARSGWTSMRQLGLL